MLNNKKHLLLAAGFAMAAMAAMPSYSAQVTVNGAACQPILQTSTGWTRDATYGYFTNKNTASSVTVVCPLPTTSTAAVTIHGYATVWQVGATGVSCKAHTYNGGANGTFTHGAAVASSTASAWTLLDLGVISMGAGGSAYVECTLPLATSSTGYSIIKHSYITY